MPSPVFCGKGPTAGHTAPAPTHPMMDFRRAACPHAAAQQTQRFSLFRPASASAERVAELGTEMIRKQGAKFAQTQKWKTRNHGKEGCVRDTLLGFPSPFKSIVFETFSKFQKLRQRDEKNFRHAAQNLGFGGVLSSLSFAVERKGAAGGMALISRRGAGETDCRTSDSVFYKGCQFRVDRRPAMTQLTSPRKSGKR